MKRSLAFLSVGAWLVLFLIGPAAADNVSSVPLWYFQAKDSDQTHLTANRDEQATIAADGKWINAEQLATVFDQQVQGTIPLYRFVHPQTGDHVFITDVEEGRQATSKYGYVAEGVCCYIATEQLSGTIPLFRLQKGNYHRYVTRPSYRDALISDGWILESMAGYVLSSVTTLPAP